MKLSRTVFALPVLGVALLTLGATSCELEGTSEQNQGQSSQGQEEKKVSAQEVYDKVQNGMTREEVDTIAGGAPDNCIDSEIAGIGTSSTCSYGSVSIMFQDGKVTSKTKL